MNREQFESLVAQAVDNLPEEFRELIENVEFVVEDRPDTAQLTEAGEGNTLLGLYEGIPMTQRGSGYGLVLPDKITIFKLPIENECRNEDEIRKVIEEVVKHEIAHYFGISDERLDELEGGED
jgi:predicted Zn-dependent protease with MMP-like domain